MPGLEILAEAINNSSNNWNIVDYLKLGGLVAAGIYCTGRIIRERLKYIHTIEQQEKSRKSACDIWIEETGR